MEVYACTETRVKKSQAVCVLSGLDPVLMRCALHPSFGCVFFCVKIKLQQSVSYY